jgi:formylglycine-generating enzyme required for sulfatase activity
VAAMARSWRSGSWLVAMLGLAVAVGGCADEGSAPPTPSLAATITPSAGVTSSPRSSPPPSVVPSAPASPPPAESASAAPVPPGDRAGDTRVDAAGVTQVWVPAGTFPMGTTAAQAAAVLAAGPPEWVGIELSSEQPTHEVTLGHGFWIDRDEVTNAGFDVFVAAGGYATRGYWSETGWAWLQGQTATLPVACEATAPDDPRACITWYEAEAYAAWRGGRLPTEAEWEYAARAGSNHPLSATELARFAWFRDDSVVRAGTPDSFLRLNDFAPRPVGTKEPNPWGFYDMLGNVWEWCSSLLKPYPYNPDDGRESLSAPGLRVMRGGGFADSAETLNSALRDGERPGRRYLWNGLRLARTVPRIAKVN